MKKQIKTRLIFVLFMICGLFLIDVMSYADTQELAVFDVVKQKSVMEEQMACVEDFSMTTLKEEILEEAKEVYYDGWVNTNSLNVRKEPNTESEILDVFDLNTYVKYTQENDNWLKIKYANSFAYVASEYVSNEKVNYIEYDVPPYSGFKSYMGYEAITNTSSLQYILQYNYCYTGTYGIRMAEDRFCVALGSYFTSEIGQYFDLILENGTIIPCILADAKADVHTDENNIFTVHSNCCSEFVVDSYALDSDAMMMGDVSAVTEDWDSPVVSIKVYEENIFD